MHTTSFYFEIYDFRCSKHIEEKQGEEINKKTMINIIYSELNNSGEENK